MIWALEGPMTAARSVGEASRMRLRLLKWCNRVIRVFSPTPLIESSAETV